jgi:hypothetical protein
MTLWLLIAFAGCGGQSDSSAAVTTPPGEPPRDPEPPAVLLGASSLECTISARENGRQTLALTSGSGIAFDAVVSPIVDGTMSLLGEDEGGEYRFTSHLAEPGMGELSGVGPVALEELETRVTVALEGYRQEAGPGTRIAFTSAQMADRGLYVEFRGVARAQNGDRHAFRVNLGAATGGSGEVAPVDANAETRIEAKMVRVEAPMTTTVVSLESRTTVEPAR